MGENVTALSFEMASLRINYVIYLSGKIIKRLSYDYRLNYLGKFLTVKVRCFVREIGDMSLNLLYAIFVGNLFTSAALANILDVKAYICTRNVKLFCERLCIALYIIMLYLLCELF